MSRTETDTRQTQACNPDEWDAVLYVQGEMGDEARAAFETRLANSASLRQETARVARAIEWLQEIPDREPSRDLAPAILKAVQYPTPNLRFAPTHRPGLAIRVACAYLAALLFVAAGLWALTAQRGVQRQGNQPDRQLTPPPGATSASPLAQQRYTAATSAAQWLLNSQEPDGSWDPRKWQGQDQYRIGLTALAVAALTRYAEVLDVESVAPAVGSAVSYIISRQQPDGSFGPEGEATMYNHGLATVALLRAQTTFPHAAERRDLTHAIEFIQSRQLPTGGWSYKADKASVPNSSLSVWQLLALNIALEQNIDVDRQARLRGLTWLRSVVNGQGQFGYHQSNDRAADSGTLTAMGALCLFKSTAAGEVQHDLHPMVRGALQRVLVSAPENVDFYRWYFVAAAIAADAQLPFGHELAPLHSALVSNRIPAGEFAGSWPLSDTWSRVGGRIYTTGMATMTLLLKTPGEP